MKKFSVIVIFILTFVFAFVMVSSPAFAATGRGDSSGGDRDGDGYISNKYGGDDCNDRKASIHPGAQEICEDGIDQDCSGADLECPPDCIPIPEICGNGIDEDCNGADLQCPPDGEININSVSSPTIVDGQAITLSGSGFGSRPIAPESFFETWDWGVAGEYVDYGDSPWQVSHGNGNTRDPARFSNEALRDGQGLYALSTRPDLRTGSQINDIVSRSGLGIDPGDKVYVSGYIWSTYAGAQEYGPDCPQQWKIWNPLTHGTPTTLTGPNMGFNWEVDGDGPDVPPLGTPQIYVAHHCGGGSSGATQFTMPFQPPIENWWQVEFEYKVASARDIQDGYFKVWFDGQLEGGRPTRSWCTDELDARVVADGFVYDTFLLRNYIQWQPSSCQDIETRRDKMAADDIVVQVGAWARVILGNAAQWNACTTRDYQPVTSWSDGSITITVNQGAFDPGQTAWLYAVNDDGVPSAGYPVTIGY